MRWASREFAKKTGEMTVDLANDATGCRRFRSDRACSTPRSTMPLRRARGAAARLGATCAARRVACRHCSGPRQARRRKTPDSVRTSMEGGAARAGKRGVSTGAWVRARRQERRPRHPSRIARGRGRRCRRRPLTPSAKGSASSGFGRCYFLWRARLRSFRCLCFRIFLRRFLITLPTGCLRTPGRSRRMVNGRDVAHRGPMRPDGLASREAGFRARGGLGSRAARVKASARPGATPPSASTPRRRAGHQKPKIRSKNRLRALPSIRFTT